MPSDATAASHTTVEKPAATIHANTKTDKHDGHDSLFERVAWVYAFCREHVFRDDTDRIIITLWPNGNPAPGTRLIELGCGPGFYSYRLAQRFPEIAVTGVDRSENQLQWARERAASLGLTNCTFRCFNALRLSCSNEEFHILIASRLFTVLPEPERAVAEMYRVLKPGGYCFIAEPRHAIRASIPLLTMWLLAGATGSNNGYREPRKATVFSARGFANLFPTQPWQKVRTWQDGHYQYAVCEKAWPA
jgi:ubiquinone/menaquinone biosynthesis C-methylase UbiE